MSENNSRSSISFNTKVKEIFNFLESEYNFHLVEEMETFVRFESDTVFINIYHGRSSYEIGVEIGLLLHENNSQFRLPTIISALAPHYTGQIFFQSSEPKVVEECLKKISNLIQKYCIKLFENDNSVWSKLSIEQQLEGQKLHEEYSVKPIKWEAEKAWKERKYKDVVKLYSSVEHYLTNTERKRLEYAKKQP